MSAAFEKETAKFQTEKSEKSKKNLKCLKNPKIEKIWKLLQNFSQNLSFDFWGFLEKQFDWCFFGQNEKFEYLKLCVWGNNAEIGCDKALKLEDYVYSFRFKIWFPSR